jgi:hypothetical protein
VTTWLTACYVLAIPLSAVIGAVGIVNILRWLNESDERRYQKTVVARVSLYTRRNQW